MSNTKTFIRLSKCLLLGLITIGFNFIARPAESAEFRVLDPKPEFLSKNKDRTSNLTEPEPEPDDPLSVVTPVPEPLTILGTSTALGFGIFLKKKKVTGKKY